MIILDISDPAHPQFISQLSWAPDQGGCTHTVLPLADRNLLVVTDESTREFNQEPPKMVRTVDVSDENQPEVMGCYQARPNGIDTAGVRFGPHNLHENRPGSYMSQRFVFATWFLGRLRILDLNDPVTIQEVAIYMPPNAEGNPKAQFNDVYVRDDGLVYVSDRAGRGLYVLEADLGKL